MIFDWKIVILVLILLVVADKLLTLANLHFIKQNFPKVNPLDAEKNPLAKKCFEKFGLTWGTIIYGIFSLLTVIITLSILAWTLKLFGVSNYQSIALYVIMMVYGIVIANNLYFLLKFSRVIP